MRGDQALAALAVKRQQSKLQREFFRLYDHDKPFSPLNVGVYDWQRIWCNAGRDHDQRMLMCANRVGKTRTGGAEVACHLTGLYPPWWEGRRFPRGISAWTGAKTNELSRDVVQLELLGELGQWGTGWLPKDRILEIKTRQAGVPDVVDTIRVKHQRGTSIVTLKTYDQGREKWQGTGKDLILLDEQPPMDIFTEALTRLLDRKGLMMLTFTPLLGLDEVVAHFLYSADGSLGLAA